MAARRSGRKSGIRIKKSNQGKLRKSTGTKKGQKVPIAKLRRLKKSKNPKTRARANFALNARTKFRNSSAKRS